MAKGERGGKRGRGEPRNGAGGEPLLNPSVEEIYEKALGPKGTPESMLEAAQNTNYNFYAAINDSERTTRGSWAWSWLTNCQRCVWAVEARARGYDVVAMPRTENDNYARPDPSVPESYLNAGAKSVELNYVGSVLRPPKAKEIKTEITDNNPNGARGMLVFNWGIGRGGHVVNYEVKNGKVRFYDGQIGREVTLSNLIKRGAITFRWGRMDDIEFTPHIQNFVQRQDNQIRS